MSTGTLTHPEHLTPRDPWGEAVQAAGYDEHGSPRLSDEELNKKFQEIVAGYDQTAEPEPTPEHTPRTSAEEIERRNRAGLLANFGIAYTLRRSNPELMAGLEKTSRPKDYTGRHRRGKHRR